MVGRIVRKILQYIYGVFMENPEENAPSENPVVKGRTKLKWIKK